MLKSTGELFMTTLALQALEMRLMIVLAISFG